MSQSDIQVTVGETGTVGPSAQEARTKSHRCSTMLARAIFWAMRPLGTSLIAPCLGAMLVALSCAEELPPPEAVGAGGSGASSGAGGGAGTAGDSGSCVCSPENGTGSCATGTCVVVSCESGFGNCDGKVENGCEESLLVDGNCGDCGRSCLGASCTAGVCGAITLATGLSEPWDLLVDDSYVYFSDFTDGYIDRVSKTDGSGRKTLASGYLRTWYMAFDGGFIYFTTQSGNSLERVKADGTAPAETLYSGTKTSAVALDDKYIYFTQTLDVAHVWRMPKQGGPVVKLVTTQVQPRAIAVDDSSVYWSTQDATSDGEVRRVDKNVTPETEAGEIVATGQGFIPWIVRDADNLFIASNSGTVSRYNIPTSKLDTLDVTKAVRYVAVDDKYLYWSAVGGKVYRLEKDYVPSQLPAPVVTLYSEDGASMRSIAVDDTALYLADDGKGRILKIAK